jgi:hypothetical protein
MGEWSYSNMHPQIRQQMGLIASFTSATPLTPGDRDEIDIENGYFD